MRKQKGFTLVELVVVVMILGILAAVAAPKLLGTSSRATDNGAKQTLAVVRDAIERYAAEHGGSLPAEGLTVEATFKTALQDYLRGEFPKCAAFGDNATVSVVTSFAGATNGPASWLYCSSTGQFIINSDGPTKSDPAITYDQL